MSVPMLSKELKELCNNEQLGISVGLENDNLFHWNVIIEGPSDTLLEVSSTND